MPTLSLPSIPPTRPSMLVSIACLALLSSPVAQGWTTGLPSRCRYGIRDARLLPMPSDGTHIGRPRPLDLTASQTYVEQEEEIDGLVSDLIPGNYDDFAVSKMYFVPPSFDNLQDVFSIDDIQKKGLEPSNMTVPTALMMLDPELYPSQSKARRICRKGVIAVLRRDQYQDQVTSFANATRALVGDRVYPGDVLARQIRVGPGYYAQTHHLQSNPLLSIVYEDDHFAVVYKPAGHTVFKDYKAKSPSVQTVLPWSLTPPRLGTLETLRKPVSVHRLDKATSGLLLTAKTKPAMIDLSRQFHDRIIQKTYMAVVNGIVPLPLEEVPEDSLEKISAEEAFRDVNVDVDPTDDSLPWYKIDFALQDQRTRLSKNATTVFRVVQQVPSLHARDGHLSLVELKPKTGRYHQLRRHMAWVCQRTLVGDSTYDGNSPEAIKFRGQGLFLSSTRVKLEHPYYNTEVGRKAWDAIQDKRSCCSREDTMGMFRIYEENGRVMVAAQVDPPAKFARLLERANDRFFKFNEGEAVELGEDEADDDDDDEDALVMDEEEL